MTEPVRTLPVVQIAGAARRHTFDCLAVEMPVALVFNGISQAVMMATPADLEAFALGFAVSEGLLLSRAECYDLELKVQAEGCEVHLQVAASAEMRLKERRRTLAGRTGCGLCGIDSLRQLNEVPARIGNHHDIQPRAVVIAMEQLCAHQPLNTQTGAHHAAAWATAGGDIVKAMEDVGRHNALDKLLGHRLLHKQTTSDGGFVVMTSRASYELVVKCARLGVPALATISAPTTLAVDIAGQTGVQLYGFCRGDQAVLYSTAR